MSALTTSSVRGQNSEKTVAKFAVWKPKEGLQQEFENGYKHHLLWHLENKDTWSWYGWYVISGYRYGYFIDATFGHSWKELDNPVNPSADFADIKLHSLPFGEVKHLYTLNFQPHISTATQPDLKAKLLRCLHLTCNNPGEAEKVFEKLHKTLEEKLKDQKIFIFKFADGADVLNYQILLPVNSFEEFGKTDIVENTIDSIENDMNIFPFNSMTSETWLYRSDMSLFPEGK